MNLVIFLSDRCDLACDYCFLSLNEGKATVLSEKNAALAVDRHLAAHGDRARVTILGGEPLLHPELALSIATRARKGGAKVGVVSNGTHATPKVAEQLAKIGAELSISIDGPAETHDKHRLLAGGGPSHAKVLAAVSKLDAAFLRANMVISEDTVGRFLSSVEWLRARGIEKISFHADVARPWSPSGLKALGAALEGFTRYARALGPALSLWHLDSFRKAVDGPGEDEDLVLGADGRYYASDAYLCRPYGQGLEGAIGDAASGPDFKRAKAILARADEGVSAALSGGVYTWPRETYLLAELQGRDPKAAVEAFGRADRLLGDALSSLADRSPLESK
jgi:hypothetical protein